MRRAAALAVLPLIAAIAVAGCGSSSSSGSAAASSDSYKSVSVTGTFNKTPKVTIPKETGTGPLYTKTLIQGTGSSYNSNLAVIANYVAYDWTGKTSKLLGSSYTVGTPSIFTGNLLTGLNKALDGQKTGSRVLAVIPPKDGFGTTGNSSAGVGKNDTLVFVIDMISTFNPNLAAKQASNGGGALPTVTPTTKTTTGPTITIPKKATAPKILQVKTLINGTGATVKSGQTLAVQYTGVNWRTGKIFDSSYLHGGAQPEQLVAATATTPGVIKGWVTGLAGQKVGSRVLLVIPPADAYGSAGASQAGIKGTDDLVFVVDILAIL